MRKVWLGAPVLLLSTVLAVLPIPAAAAGPPLAAASPEPPSVPDQLLVGFVPGADAGERAVARSEQGARLVETVAAGGGGMARVELVALPVNSDERAVAARFERNGEVQFVERNWLYTTGLVSNDLKYTDGSLWGMYGDATSPTNQFGSQAGEAWSAGRTGSAAVYVGIIDEGVQWTHPDLDANIWSNPFDVADGVDNDRNGFIDDVRGWDFDGNNSSTYDGKQDDHGTHVAGTIGAEGGNGIGVAGVNWNVRLITAKFLGRRGGTAANAIKAVDYFTDLKTRHGLNLVATNNSWGGGGFSQALKDAITRANAADILFVAAAGNGGGDGVGDNNDVTASYPSSYDVPNVIAVAAIDKAGALASFSNYGAANVDLGAPGVGVWSALPDHAYGSYSGTSMATPHVTGGAALYAATRAGATAATIKAAILTAAAPTTSLEGKTSTKGRLDVSGF